MPRSPHSHPPARTDQTKPSSFSLLSSMAGLTSHRDLDDLGNKFVQTLITLFDLDYAGLYMPSHGKHGNVFETEWSGQRHRPGDCVLTERIQGDPTLHTSYISEMPETLYLVMRGKCAIARYLSENTFELALPVHLREGTGALIHVKGHGNLSRLRLHIEPLIRVFGNHLSLVKESEVDALTGLLNRKSFDQKVGKLMAVQQTLIQMRHQEAEADAPEKRTAPSDALSTWLAVVDLDHFKRVNDTYGHLYGDEVLLIVAQIMRGTFRKSDLLFRFGGEEFVIVLEPVTDAGAEQVFERFRESVEARTIPKVGHVTLSLGYTRLASDQPVFSAIDRADAALYHAKAQGRNRAFRYETLVAAGEIAPLTHAQDDIELF